MLSGFFLRVAVATAAARGGAAAGGGTLGELGPGTAIRCGAAAGGSALVTLGLLLAGGELLEPATALLPEEPAAAAVGASSAVTLGVPTDPTAGCGVGTGTSRAAAASATDGAAEDAGPLP